MNVTISSIKSFGETYHQLKSPKGILLFSIHEYVPGEQNDQPGFFIREEVGCPAMLPEGFDSKRFEKQEAAIGFCKHHLKALVDSLS